jgi:hypothetical protein
MPEPDAVKGTLVCASKQKKSALLISPYYCIHISSLSCLRWFYAPNKPRPAIRLPVPCSPHSALLGLRLGSAFAPIRFASPRRDLEASRYLGTALIIKTTLRRPPGQIRASPVSNLHRSGYTSRCWNSLARQIGRKRRR